MLVNRFFIIKSQFVAFIEYELGFDTSVKFYIFAWSIDN